ncbi:MerR family DNA-binding transcriptional regulator [Nocardia sp. CDC159]|uniref:MerR family DNA-binding transcriptional regulator n=1 Tax=Nocardia pulmonis TaxID=2951408 RepID=A0A9X2IW58_9NOCA|nr:MULTISPECIES: MerR family DNA-binding transcriptional regulator [Nocardia]MCM6774607.1 MerR family DNA-binding transcriptional regulator [Nocardia pulmonis]MCM6787328.1 MerR family DNA-binding transcriptional regulator [Nocardia sp. CDC159]
MSEPAQQWRPIDLARLAGISPQQIRNYVDAGILPSVTRTPAGYRRFGARHAAALQTFRGLLVGFGPIAGREIMQAVHAGDLDAALAVVDDAHAALREQRRSLDATAEALAALANQKPTATPRSGLRIGEVATRLGVRASALRVWEAEGLLTPGREPGTGYRVFGPADVRDAQVVTVLRRGHHRFDQIRPILDDLHRTGSSSALRATLARRRTELTARARAMLAGAAELHRYLSEYG